MAKIGIDFGTSFCSASWLNPNTRRPEAITFHETGSQKMPSVVHYKSDGQIYVGQAAYNMLEDAGKLPEEERRAVLSSTITSVKRRMDDECFYFHDRKITPQEIIKDILLKIKTEAEVTCFKETITEANITHPVNFEERKKELLKAAAQKAGFQTVHLFEEPVSAAIGYLESTGRQSSGILVYDFGGGTFDVAYLKKENNHWIPLFTEGDSECGGDDIDALLYDEWNKLAQREHQRGITENRRTIDIEFLARCRKQKQDMSIMTERTCNELLPPPGIKRVKMTLHRQEFENIISPVIEKTIKKTQFIVDKIMEGNYPLDTAILIGGSSRIPMIKNRLTEILPCEPQPVMTVDIAVALGAIMCGDKVIDSSKPCYCYKCGEKINRSYKHCIHCGEKNTLYNR